MGTEKWASPSGLMPVRFFFICGQIFECRIWRFQPLLRRDFLGHRPGRLTLVEAGR